MKVHPFIIRPTHWLNVFAILCIMMSGCMIYDASPLFGFRFPACATLGGWLGGAIAWHLPTAWLLVATGSSALASALGVEIGWVFWKGLALPGPG